MKKLRNIILYLLLVVLTVFPAFSQAGTDPADAEAEKLIDKASYHYGLVEDYPGALRLLQQALQKAQSPRLKAIALVKTAYVHFLMDKEPQQFRRWIEQALQHDPDLELDKVYYKLSFIKIFKRIKKKPDAFLPDSLKPAKRAAKRRAEKKRKKFFLGASFNYLMHSDEGFRETYGSGKMFPRITAGFYFSRVIFIWAGYGTLSAAGTVPETTFEADSAQSYISLGGGFQGFFTGKMRYRVGFGIMKTDFEESAIGLSYSDSTSGFDLFADVAYDLAGPVYIDASIGYISATATAFNEKINIGGLRTGIGLGLRF